MSVPEAQSLAAAGPGPPKDLRPLPLPLGIQSGYIQTADLTYHFLVSGIKTDQSKGLILLVHGFPELAFSWRHVMPALAREGYQVVAFDQRGYGRTTGWDTRPYDEADISTFAFTRIVQDVVGLVFALGYRTVRCLIGHDFGAVGASCCALVRPDVFER
jgi:pimeloyl-ACP methyl ester carboxylesterase